MALFAIICNFAIVSLELAAAILGCWLVRRSWERPYKALVILAVVTVIGERSTSFLMRTRFNPLLIYVWMTPYETWTILYFLGATQSGKWMKRIHIFLAASMLILQPVYFSLSPPVDLIFENLYLQEYFCLLLLTVSCGVLFQIVQHSMDRPIWSHPNFWMAIGILGYSTVFSMLTIMVGFKSLRYWFKPVNLLGNICMYGGFIMCFIKYARIRRALKPSV